MSRLIWYFILSIVPVMLLLPGEPSNMLRNLLDPAKIYTTLDNLGSSGVKATLSGETGNPLDHIKERSNMWTADAAVLDSEGGMPVFRSQVLADWQGTGLADVPGTITRHALLTDCAALARPAQGDRVALVSGGAAMKGGLMFGRDDKAFHKAVEDFLRNQRLPVIRSRSSSQGAQRESAFDAYDVVVTRTDAPVHLVLSGAHLVPRLWNLHLAPGARISRVTLLGGGRDGLANQPQGVPVEAIDAATLAACGAREAYPLSEIAFIHQSAASGILDPDEYHATLDRIDGEYRAWAQWFGAIYGADPLDRMVGFDEGIGVLIGPVPAAPEGRAVWHPLKGAAVSLPEGLDAMPAGEEGVQAMQAAVEAKAREIAGPAFDKLAQYPRRARTGGI